MPNNKNEYASIAWAFIASLGDDAEQMVIDTDDGENSTVVDGKELCHDLIDSVISDLQDFKNDVSKYSFKEFKTKYSYL